jgi:hypothetical protein
VRHAGLLSTQPEADFRALEAALEEGFGLLIAGFDTLVEQVRH